MRRIKRAYDYYHYYFGGTACKRRTDDLDVTCSGPPTAEKYVLW